MNKKTFSVFMQRAFFLSVLFFSLGRSYAQYVDYNIIPPSMTNQMTQQFNQALEDYKKQMDKISNVSIMAVPCADNSFFLIMGTVGNVNRKNITLYTKRNGRKTSKPLTSYPYQLAYVVTPAEFLPGDEICIYYNERIQQTEKIPALDSPQYNNFCQLRLKQAQNLLQTTMQNNLPTINTPMSGNQSYNKQSTCSLCEGKGWIRGSRTPTYGNTGQIYCSECNGHFPHSHSHDRCPACQGRGYTNY